MQLVESSLDREGTMNYSRKRHVLICMGHPDLFGLGISNSVPPVIEKLIFVVERTTAERLETNLDVTM